MEILTEAYNTVASVAPSGILISIDGKTVWTGGYQSGDYIIKHEAARLNWNESKEVSLKIIFKTGYVPMSFHINTNDVNFSIQETAKAYTYFYNGLN